MSRRYRRFRRVLASKPGLVVGAVNGVLLAVAGFGTNLSGDQVAAIMLAVAPVISLFSELAIDRKVGIRAEQAKADTLAEVQSMADG